MSAAVFYIAAMSTEADGGIYRYEMRADAAPEQVGFNALPRTSYLAFSPDRKFLYATCRIDGVGAVAAFAVGSRGELTFLNSCSAEGQSTCYVIVSPNGRFLYAANYSSGSFAEFRLENGRIAERTRLVVHSGRGSNPARQEMAHPHFTGLTPDGRFLCVIDLGIDAIKLYPLDPETGIDPERVRTVPVLPAGSGPRHLVFDSTGGLAYLLNELGNTVISMRYRDGSFEPIATETTLPRLFTGETKAAAIRLSPDERFLFATNRGFDSVAVFRLDGKGGMTPVDLVLSGGESPRDVNFLPGGRMFASTNEFSNSVVFFDYDAETGKLTPNGLSFKLPNPLHLFW